MPGRRRQPRTMPGAWQHASSRYRRRTGRGGHWLPAGAMPDRWTIRHDPVVLELRPTRAGHVGLFPEQAPCWDWIAQRLAAAARPLKVLNLFAYTGGSTLSAAATGAQVVHVDAARNTVVRARVNARLSALTDAAVRWITEDAARFAGRELRRGNGYDAVVLDPPSYGHGPRGEAWKLTEHLRRLLQVCGQLTAGRLAFALLTCHTPGFGPAVLAEHMTKAGLGQEGRIETGPLQLTALDGRILPSGSYARWCAKPTRWTTSA